MDAHQPHNSLAAATQENVHHSSSRKKHSQMFNEINKRTAEHHHHTTDMNSNNEGDQERPRLKRQPTKQINNVNYCCAMPKDIKLCKSLICGHYE